MTTFRSTHSTGATATRKSTTHAYQYAVWEHTPADDAREYAAREIERYEDGIAWYDTRLTGEATLTDDHRAAYEKHRARSQRRATKARAELAAITDAGVWRVIGWSRSRSLAQQATGRTSRVTEIHPAREIA